MNKYLFFIFYTLLFYLTLSPNLKAQNINLKSEYQLNYSDNVDSTHSNQVKDFYSDIIETIQRKNDYERFKIKLKFEKFQKATSDDNFYFNINYQSTPDKTNQYTIELYNQSYRGNHQVNIDNFSDNKGAKLSLTKNNEVNDQISIYYSFSSHAKNFQKQKRNDLMIDGAIGLYSDLSSSISFGPEFNMEYDFSTDPFNTNFNFTPGFYSTVRVSNYCDLALSSYYTYIQYVKKSVSDYNLSKEHQAFWGNTLTLNYNFSKQLIIAGKFGLNHNYSNNFQATYNVRLYSLNFGISF